MRFSATLFLVLALFSAASSKAPRASQNVSLVYDGGTSRLQLTRSLPMTLTVYAADLIRLPSGKDRVRYQPLALVHLNINATEVTGRVKQNPSTPEVVTHALVIKFNEIISGENVTLRDFELTLEMTADRNRWTLSNATATFAGDLADNSTASTFNESLKGNVSIFNALLPNPRNTSNPANRICTRGITTCAPRDFCWTCNDHNLRPLLYTNMSFPRLAVGVVLPGMQLQPFLKNESRFGLHWDCDPVLSIGVWQGLIFSVLFALVVIWAVSYLGSIAGPNRFDDPKGKPISVPQN